MTTVYVSTTGDDSRSYATAQNPATPWLTPAKVLSSATSGDTAIFAVGTYTLTAHLAFTSKAFTFIAAVNNLVVIDGNSAYGITSTTSASSLTATGIRFYRFKNTIYCISLQNLNFTNCIIDSFNCPALDISSYHGGFGNPADGTVTHVFTSCDFINLYSSSNGASRAYLFGYRSYGGSTIINLTMTWCTFMFYTNWATASSFYVFGNFYNITGGADVLKNNVFDNRTGQVINFNQTRTAGTRVSTYSDAYNITSPLAGTGNLTLDPLLVDPLNATPNLNLQMLSPCIDSGSN